LTDNIGSLSLWIRASLA